MKTLVNTALKIIIILFLILGSCVSSQKVREGVIYKTRIYVGYYLKSAPYDDNYTTVLTSQGIFRLKENPEIPDSAWCYIRIEPTRFDVDDIIAEKLSPKFFSWNGSDKEYKVFNKIDNLNIMVNDIK